MQLREAGLLISTIGSSGIRDRERDADLPAALPPDRWREYGEMFVGESLTEQELIDSMQGVEFVIAPAAHHYSNLAFALLGQVVAHVSSTLHHVRR